MIAIVYSGAKSAFWKLSQGDKPVIETSTSGINPCFNDQKQLLQTLGKNIILIHHAESIKKIYVFSAGASSKEKQTELVDSLQLFFINSKIKVKDDVHGAAIAACHDKPGIVGILGSNANCAYFNGKNPEKNNYALGYILADEGSANYFGKILLKNFLEERLPTDIKTKLQEKYNLDRPTILERVYRKPNVQTYLSSFIEFYLEHREHKHIQQLIDDGFEKYIRTYIIPISHKHPNEDIHFVGSVAGAFQDRLRLVADKLHVNIISVTKEPIHNIFNYYTN